MYLISYFVPPVEIALHDHNYTPVGVPILNAGVQTVLDVNDAQSRTIACTESIIEAKLKFNVTPKQRIDIEENTRNQAQSFHWFAVRSRRITGSKCGRILCQQKSTVPLLKSVLYSKPLSYLPAIDWGVKHESSACAAYVAYMVSIGHNNLSTQTCGFIIHPEMGWLGASPDALVFDPSSTLTRGIAEFKCPFSKKNIKPADACDDPGFCCAIRDGKFQLKRNHRYYHQVQLQLYVGMDLYNWCDFCVYTLKGVAVERIYADTEWCNLYIPELESYFDAYMLPEIVNPMYKPSYIL